jgi:hypothetical protein
LCPLRVFLFRFSLFACRFYNIMFKDDVGSARNLKFILCFFERLIGLKIKFNKSEDACFGNRTLCSYFHLQDW